jgi:SAICAR synthetase
MVQVECIARGYLAGLGLEEYRAGQSISGVQLPPGLLEGSKLPTTVFAPTTKASAGAHDEFITYPDVVDQVGAETAARLRDLTIELYDRGAEMAAKNGVIIADTKFEFGWTPDGTLVLADEILTSDSSRFWPADDWQPGRQQFSFDKQSSATGPLAPAGTSGRLRRRYQPTSLPPPRPATQRSTNASRPWPGPSRPEDAMTPQQQIYNPYHLIEEVAELLRGLDPYVAEGHAGDALGGAGRLLRAFGIAPLMDAGDAFPCQHRQSLVRRGRPAVNRGERQHGANYERSSKTRVV